MRKLSSHEFDTLYEKHHCPFCDSPHFYEGPHGGWSVNIYCEDATCGAGFNVGPHGMGYLVINEPGERQNWEGTVQDVTRRRFEWAAVGE